MIGKLRKINFSNKISKIFQNQLFERKKWFTIRTDKTKIKEKRAKLKINHGFDCKQQLIVTY